MIEPVDFSEGSSLNEMVGRLACWVILKRVPPPPDKAGPFHDAIAKALRNHGFRVWREFPVDIRESGRGQGYLDLFATYRGGKVALELDRRSPKTSSKDKLRAFNAYRIIVLRGAMPWPKERGIDAILTIPVLQ